MPVAGVVLAGGRSSRMGTDKALLAVDGIPMARRVADALAAGGCDPVWCQGGDADELAAIGLTVRPDPSDHPGPLAAIAEALAAAAPADLVIAACDLPDLDGATVRAIVAGSVSQRATAERAPLVAVADDGSGAHLLAWWSAAALAPLQALLADDVMSYRVAVERLGAHHVPVSAAAVRNVNHPVDVGRRG
jgi:molybdopterin-guanine dinucleotide biosynthesis protein A